MKYSIKLISQNKDNICWMHKWKKGSMLPDCEYDTRNIVLLKYVRS
jgi:hypothetical protein